MPAHQFNVIVKQIVEREINVDVDANTEAEALAVAKLAFSEPGQVTETIMQEIVDRNMMIDEEVDNELLRMAENHSRLDGAR
ncbi:MAG TPA: hypothetical protein VGR71_02810 [Nitrospira sp.]|nr:hypothetical protein [Nitrospira sp.]